MQIKKKSHFKDQVSDLAWFDSWVSRMEAVNKRPYEKISLNTSLGKTTVWGLESTRPYRATLVIFPGARTSSLFWDFDKGLDVLKDDIRIFLVETNGLPNSSDGNTPSIKSDGYGIWAGEILDQLQIEKTFIAGASFGGLICMKLCIVKPERIHAAFLLNPGCLQSFSLSISNLYYNLLPIISPSEKNVRTFLDKAVFCRPVHQLSRACEQLIIDYEVFALKRYIDRTEKPYDMANELKKVESDVYLMEGDRDLLFPFERSIKNAKDRIKNLKQVKVFKNVGHGIETYHEAIENIGLVIRDRQSEFAD